MKEDDYEDLTNSLQRVMEERSDKTAEMVSKSIHSAKRRLRTAGTAALVVTRMQNLAGVGSDVDVSTGLEMKASESTIGSGSSAWNGGGDDGENQTDYRQPLGEESKTFTNPMIAAGLSPSERRRVSAPRGVGMVVEAPGRPEMMETDLKEFSEGEEEDDDNGML